MPEPVDLLLLTHNRRRYLEKSLPQLFADDADFRLYCWDNASTDGAADIIASLDDERVVHRHFSRENVGQTEPSFWFLDKVAGDVVGKVDDDILLPVGWIDRITPMVRERPELGMIGCWIFMPEDWDEELAAHNIVKVGGYDIFRCTTVAGQSFLARRGLLREYRDDRVPGLPINRRKMAVDGYISGTPAKPLLTAHNMDDPRSPHCLMRDEHEGQEAFTMRRLGFASVDEYAAWIADDARKRQAEPIEKQLKRMRLLEAKQHSLLGRVRWKLATLMGAV